MVPVRFYMSVSTQGRVGCIIGEEWFVMPLFGVILGGMWVMTKGVHDS